MSMDDVTFTRGPARRPMPRVSDPLLQWATGLQTKERRIYAGWLAEAGKIQALTRQYEVLDAVDAFRAQDKKPPMNPPFYASSIPLGPGQEVARGSGGQTREITPPIANIPTPITKEYVRAHWIKRDWSSLIEGMLDDTIRWSATSS